MSLPPSELAARYHRAFNDRDFDVWREVFDEDVELVVEGMPFRGVDAAVRYGVTSVQQFPRLSIASERVVALAGDTIVTEIRLANGDPDGHVREQGTACEICRVRDGRIVSVRSYYMPEGSGRDDAVRVPARREAAVVAEEQASLRRVATLVARGVSEDELFAAVTQEIGWLVGADTTSLTRFELDDTVTLVAAWSSSGADLPIGANRPLDDALRSLRETGRPGRWGPEDMAPTGPFVDEARALGVRTSVGVPVVVEGRIWGFAFANSNADRPFADAAESRIVGFTELVATAIANAQARGELSAMAKEQAALRRVATLLARATQPEEVFAAVAEEVGLVLAADVTGIGRYERDGTAVAVGTWARTGDRALLPVGTRVRVGGHNAVTRVFETGRPARTDHYSAASTSASGEAAAFARQQGFGSVIGAPINVEGRRWGVMLVISMSRQPKPADTEARLAAFTELIATAIGNTQGRLELRRFADEQAALGRVATLVARATRPEDVFGVVAEEVGRALGADVTGISRYDPDGTAAAVGAWARTDDVLPFPVGTRVRLGGRNVVTGVFERARPVRLDGGAGATGEPAAFARTHEFGSVVGAPIHVEGRLWGVVMVMTRSTDPMPADAEARLTAFTGLVATAIANAQARMELRGFADEQAALRRVATLVARDTPPVQVFTAVAEEAGQLLKVDYAVVSRYDADGYDTVIGGWAKVDPGRPLPIGMRVKREGRNVHSLVFETRRPARVDDYDTSTGEFAEVARMWGFRSSVGTPISVEGRVWGVMIVGSRGDPLAAETERRLTGFTELAAAAIANAEAQAALTASRARIVAAADTARRRFERNLHDGAQQRLVSLALQLQSAQEGVPSGAGDLAQQLSGIADGLIGVLDEVREIARGLHPAVLAKGGLRTALRTLARRSAIQVSVDVRVEGRFPEPVEIATYYVVSEALTNATKHACASGVDVTVDADGAMLQVCVRDDGVGGADLAAGSGLVGMRDRVEALGGRLSLHSPRGAGTTLEISLPLAMPSPMP